MSLPRWNDVVIWRVHPVNPPNRPPLSDPLPLGGGEGEPIAHPTMHGPFPSPPPRGRGPGRGGLVRELSVLTRCALIWLALACGVRESRGQYIDIWQTQESLERSRWLPTLNYIKTEVEVERDSFRSSTGTNRFDSGRLYVAPALGIGWNNYIYHPYLLTYSALFEPGYTFLNAGPAGATRETQELTLDGHLTANLLEIKPYGLTLNYNHSHGEIKYDLFDSALVDSQGWGVAGGYREGPVPVTVSFNQSHEDSAGFNQNTTSDETMINLHARNERQKENATELTYQYGVFEREIAASKARYRSANSFQYLSLMDLEHFQKSTLRSTLLFYDIESAGSSSQNLNATLGYNLELAPHLQTYENYSLGWFSGTTSDSIQNYGAAGIQHHLFESLSWGVELHGSTTDRA